MAFLDNIPFLKRIVEMATTLLIAIVLSVLVGLILAFPVMWLWNYLFVPMNPIMKITVFQAWALNVLAGVLFASRNGKK
ncbi:MAG TPA: hypothetical protein VJB12_02030 [Candidatus Nanoarchaeia archaeon]|nr:hypothetical protein [Candidatus Nanoarchaeia archaeon]